MGPLEYKITHDVIEAATYSIIIKAENKWGYAQEFSSPCTILAATVPEQVTGLTTNIDSVTGGISINWDAPHDRGTALTTYTVQLYSNVG
jgi:hypothetical protein